jgi:redox-sensitive bicupin YhaK (pirin superfamily)
MRPDAVLAVAPLGFPWATLDPFLFCVHHDDRYPAGNARLGPAASLAGRNLGMDFEGKDGWRMYHGDVVPGFPQHPHRGFETVTVARRGFIDHSDSLGATARFGRGDAQWMTAGRGIVHAEMFPLLDPAGENPLELFQIWLNLPIADKLVEPHFAMLWSEEIPTRAFHDDAGRVTEVTAIAGPLCGVAPPSPPPRSWAARAESQVAIWTIKLAPGARHTLAPAAADANRALYFFAGAGLAIAGHAVHPGHAIKLHPDRPATIENGPGESELLLLQGRPIGEPVVQAGPFVMGSALEVQRAFLDYRRTQFGGWPWPSDDPVHGTEGRFAKHADGKIERAED